MQQPFKMCDVSSWVLLSWRQCSQRDLKNILHILFLREIYRGSHASSMKLAKHQARAGQQEEWLQNRRRHRDRREASYSLLLKWSTAYVKLNKHVVDEIVTCTAFTVERLDYVNLLLVSIWLLQKLLQPTLRCSALFNCEASTRFWVRTSFPCCYYALTRQTNTPHPQMLHT